MTKKRFQRLSSSIDYYYCVDTENKDKGLTVEDMLDLLNVLSEENEELQERNNRQAKSLEELSSLIEKEDWETLKQIIQDIKNEEQLQKEGGGCYE